MTSFQFGIKFNIILVFFIAPFTIRGYLVLFQQKLHRLIGLPLSQTVYVLLSYPNALEYLTYGRKHPRPRHKTIDMSYFQFVIKSVQTMQANKLFNPSYKEVEKFMDLDYGNILKEKMMNNKNSYFLQIALANFFI
jgi:hypothetical protein